MKSLSVLRIALLLVTPLALASELYGASPSASAPASRAMFGRRPLAAQQIPRLRQLQGMGTMVDATLSPYYRDRSPRGLAKEIRGRGFDWVLAYANSLTPDLAAAIRVEGMALGLQLWGTIIYGPERLAPPPPAEALQVFASGPQTAAEQPKFYCPSSEAFVAWHRGYALAQLARFHPDMVLVIESFLGDIPGPTNRTYGCVCPRCCRRFAEAHGGQEAPEFKHTGSPRYWQTDKARYQRWVSFRAKLLADFTRDLYGGIAQTEAKVALAGTMLALGQPDGLSVVRECNGQDAALLARAAPWDLFFLQAHWPDWSRPGLTPREQVEGYRPFLDALHKEVPDLRVGILGDSGSNEDSRRSLEWIREADSIARSAGFTGFGIYEYAVSGFIYSERPRVIESTANAARREIEVVFSKRLDRPSATASQNYTLGDGTHPREIAFDGGNIVLLRFDKIARPQPATLRIQDVRDDATAFWFNAGRPRQQQKYPSQVIDPDTRIDIKWRR